MFLVGSFKIFRYFSTVNQSVNHLILKFMNTKASSTAVATTAENSTDNVKVLHDGKPFKNVESVLSKLAEVKNAEKNYLVIKGRKDELSNLMFLDGNGNQQLSLIDSEGNRFVTTSAKVLNSVKTMLVEEANLFQSEVEAFLLNATLA